MIPRNFDSQRKIWFWEPNCCETLTGLGPTGCLLGPGNILAARMFAVLSTVRFKKSLRFHSFFASRILLTTSERQRQCLLFLTLFWKLSLLFWVTLLPGFSGSARRQIAVCPARGSVGNPALAGAKFRAVFGTKSTGKLASFLLSKKALQFGG